MHIDLWTLGLQTLNVLVLVWLLGRFLFRPITAIIAARQAEAEKLLADAAARRAEAQAAADAVARQNQVLTADGDHILAQARAAAEAERATLLQHASVAAERLRAEAADAIAQDRAAMRDALEHDAAELAVSIAEHLLQRVPPQHLTRIFLDDLIAAIARHPARHLLADAPVQLSSPAPLDAAAEETARTALTRALGAAPALSFAVDPALLAGLELTSPHLSIRNSWRADLQRIAATLAHAESHDIPEPVA